MSYTTETKTTLFLKNDPLEKIIEKPIKVFYGFLFGVLALLIAAFALLPFTEGLETLISASFITAGVAIPMTYQRISRTGTKAQATVVAGLFTAAWVFNFYALTVVAWG